MRVPIDGDHGLGTTIARHALRPAYAVALLLVVHFAACAWSIARQSLTYDESNHYAYGMKISRLDPDLGPHDSKMPFSVVNTIPYHLSVALGKLPILHGLASGLASFDAARVVTVCFSLLLGVGVFRWSRALYGVHGALLSLALVAFDPTILAHGSLVTTDLFASLMVLVALYRYWVFLREPTVPHAALSATTLGLAQLSKYTAVYLYPLFVLLFLGAAGTRTWRDRGVGEPGRLLRRGAGFFALFVAASIVIINAGFLFHGTATPLRDYRLRSHLFLSLQRTPLLRSLPLPLPVPFVEGLDRVKHNETTGATFPGIYLRGEVRRSGEEGFRGFKTYFLWCWLLKVPLATQLLVSMALLGLLRPDPRRGWRKDEAFLLVPSLFFMAYFSLCFNAQLGIRFLLPIFPLMHIFCGRLLKDWPAVSPRRRVAYGTLVVYLAASAASYAPHFIPYFNELVPDRTRTYRFLADSNLDWGQATPSIRDYLRSHPGTQFHPPHPMPGRILVAGNALVGLTDPEWFRWLRENFEPVGHVAYAVFVFEVTEHDLRELKRRGALSHPLKNPIGPGAGLPGGEGLRREGGGQSPQERGMARWIQPPPMTVSAS
ncbi:glycosyltransferase family 39 protein [Candidatus Fermentibacteria bacterium]|nr:glycosyltransferase family 39 protein [Candidatus Fermentibacteria bacterium]